MLTIDDLTEDKVEGNGTFDRLMSSVRKHIHEEYRQNRIKGPEYSGLYLGSLQSVLSESIRYLIDKNNAELTQKQIDLAVEQRLLIKKQIIQADKDANKTDSEINLLNTQKDKTQSEIVLLEIQRNKTQSEINLLNQKIETERAQIKGVGIESNSVIGRQLADTVASTAIKDKTRDKIQSEINLLNQKIETERAQIKGTGIEGNSVIGKQLDLYTQQTLGYQRDSATKAAKLLVDTWSIRAGLGDADTSGANKLTDADIGNAVSKMNSLV